MYVMLLARQQQFTTWAFQVFLSEPAFGSFYTEGS
jgi:hypothetical protein